MDIYQELTQLGFFENRTTAAGYRTVFNRTAAKLPAGSHVLDWGCGTGRLSYFLLKQGMQVTSYNIEDILKLGDEFSKRWPNRFVYRVGTEPLSLPFASESFDAVFSLGVLEHVRETGGTEAASLAELRRVLKPGGSFFCFHLPQKYSWIEWTGRQLRLKTYMHTSLYTRADVTRLLSEAGFELREFMVYNAVPRQILSRLPRFLKDSSWFCSAYNMLDNTLAFVAPLIAQNIYFLATKDRAADR